MYITSKNAHNVLGIQQIHANDNDTIFHEQLFLTI